MKNLKKNLYFIQMMIILQNGLIHIMKNMYLFQNFKMFYFIMKHLELEMILINGHLIVHIHFYWD